MGLSGKYSRMMTEPPAGKRFASQPYAVSSSPYGARFEQSSSGYTQAAPRPHRRHTVPFVILGLLIGVLVGLGVYGGMLFSSLQRVKAQATELVPAAQHVVNAVKTGDDSGLASNVQTLQSGLQSIDSELNGSLWTIAAHVPVYGQDVTNARKLLSVCSDAVDGILVPLASTLAANPIDSIVQDGNINGPSVQALCDALSGVTPAITSAIDGFNSVGTFHVTQINDMLDQLHGPLKTAGNLLDENGDLIRMLPDILGCNGPRNYLVIAQNNVEVRATGGFPGAMALVTLDNGQIAYGDVQPVTILNTDYTSIVITPEESAIFGGSLGGVPGNMNYTPDFSRAADLWSQAWLRDLGQQLDGIVALDPVLFGRIFALTGQTITLADGTVVDGSNFAAAMMHDTYWDYNSLAMENGSDADEMMNARFADSATRAVDAIKQAMPTLNKKALLATIRQGIAEGRFSAWSNNPDEENLIKKLGFAGTLYDDPTAPVLGVYLNDDTWSKMSWWLTLSTSIDSSQRNADGSTTYHVTTTLGSTMTGEEADSASSYIIGSNPLKRDNSDIITWMYLVAPASSSISNVQVGGSGELSMTDATYEGHQLSYGRSQLLAGQDVTVTYDVTVSAQATSELAVHQTPLAQQ